MNLDTDTHSLKAVFVEGNREAGKRQELRVLNSTERPRRCSHGRAHLGSDVKHEEGTRGRGEAQPRGGGRMNEDEKRQISVTVGVARSPNIIVDQLVSKRGRVAMPGNICGCRGLGQL